MRTRSSLNQKNVGNSATLAAAILITLLASGCTSSSSSSPDDTWAPKGPSYGEDDSKAEPDWFHEGDLFERSAVPADLQVYADMQPSEYAALTKEEQAPYFSWLMEYRAQYVSWYGSLSPSLEDREPRALDASSDASAILTDYLYSVRMMYSFVEGGTTAPQEDGRCGQLDVDAVTKAAYFVTTSWQAADELANDILSAGSYCALELATTDTLSLAPYKDVTIEHTRNSLNGKMLDAANLTFTNDSGAVYSLNVWLQPVRMSDGSVQNRTVIGDLIHRQ